MESVVQLGGGPRVSKRHFWICLLPLLFLHNPFLTAPDSSGQLSVQHPPSYRATIASAELLKFKNPEGLESIARESVNVLDRDRSNAIILVEPRTELARTGDSEDLLPPEQVLSSSLSFRSPPAA